MKRQGDRYGEVTARYYDAAYAQNRDPSGDGAFYRALANEARGPVLELGCGTGRILLPIARDGIPCTGIDLSPSMLEAFRAKGIPENLQLIEGRMQDFDLGHQRFALVTVPFRAFQHLSEVKEQIACLKRARRHLAPGGTFAFDFFKPRLDRLARREEPEAEDARWPDGDDEIIRTASVTRNHATQMMQVFMHYSRTRNGEVVLRESTDFSMRYFFRYEVEHLLARAGFRNVTLFGDFDRTPFGEDSPEMIFLAR